MFELYLNKRETPNMSQNISANLDLNKSILDFQETVIELLDLTSNISEWDGRTIRDKEQKIREASLILAGQCVALLLYNLSQLKSAQETAIEQTLGWWRTKSRRHGKCWRQVLTMGNVTVSLHLPYVVERRQSPKGKRKARHQGFCPFLRWLGMEEGVTPLVWSTIAQYGTISSSFAAAATTLINWGIRISVKRIERLTYHFGRVGLSLREAKIFQLRNGSLPTGKVLKDQRVVICADGGRSKIRREKKGRRNPKTNRRGFHGEWVEPKLLTIYTVDEKGKKMKTGEIPITNDGTYGDFKDFLEILEMYLVSLGISQAKQVLLLADGAEWIWNHIPPLLERLNCPTPYQLRDFYHVTEHLQDFADAAFSEEKERKTWFKQARSDLKRGKISSLLEEMKTLRKPARGQRRQIMTAQINYLSLGFEKGRLNYDQISSINLPIGSGAVESLIRQVVNLRLKGNGKFWLRRNAEIILHARCQWVAGNWQNFCDSILTALIAPATA